MNSEYLRNMLAHYQHETQTEKFNNDFIYLRSSDDLIGYFEDTCKALEIIDGIKFKRAYIETDRFEVEKMLSHLNIEESKLDLVKIDFEFTDSEETKEFTFKIFYPKLVNGFYFYLNGNRYYPIWQVVDKNTYNSKNVVVLKTLLFPLVLVRYAATFEDDTGKEWNFNDYRLHIFRQKQPTMLYLLAKYGIHETLSKFGFDESDVKFASSGTKLKDYVSFQVSKIKKTSIFFSKRLIENEEYSWIVAGIMFLLNNRVDEELFFSKEYWVKRIGMLYAKNTAVQMEKGNKILLSLERIFDERTKKNLVELDDDEKQSVYDIINHLVHNFQYYNEIDIYDLHHKRLRFHEYLINPFLTSLSGSTYRLMSSKIITVSTMESIFRNISPFFIIKKMLSSDLLRYSNNVNDMSLFGSMLKFTKRGPQSIASSSSSIVEIGYRDNQPSFIGKISLVQSSAGDPGKQPKVCFTALEAPVVLQGAI